MILVISFFVLLVLLLLAFYIANKMVRHTNWYKNNFVHTHQFDVPTENKSLDIVNLGSNPALFSLFYEDMRGENWATGSQSPTMDLAILKTYQERLREGGVVLIPIVAFSSCSPYLDKYKPSWHDDKYYARFAKVLGDNDESGRVIPNLARIKRWMKHPLWYNRNAWRFLIRDCNEDNRRWETEQKMQLPELERDADRWMTGWMREFDIKDLNAPLDAKMEKCHEECARMFADIVDYCKKHNFKPYLLFPPVSWVLAERFSDKTKETYIYSFVRRIQSLTEVQFLDYMADKDFSDTSLYFNSFFLNLRGRKLFTRRVVEDIGLSNKKK